MLRGFNIVPYLPVIEFLLVLIAIVALGMTLLPYLILRRGSLWQYLVTVVSVPPMMVYMSVSNAPSILKTVFRGSREQIQAHAEIAPEHRHPGAWLRALG